MTLDEIKAKQERYFCLLEAKANDCDTDELSDLEYYFAQKAVPWLIEQLTV